MFPLDIGVMELGKPGVAGVNIVGRLWKVRERSFEANVEQIANLPHTYFPLL